MAKKGEKIIKEANIDDEKMQMSIRHNLADEVEVRGKKLKVRWMHPYTEDRITQLMLEDGNDSKVLCQCAALIVLGGYWKSKFLYWLRWRWYYYVKQYTSQELLPLFEMAQKKTVQEEATAYLNATILLTALKDTKKQMTKAEAARTLRELRGGNDGKSPKNTPG